MTKAPAFQFYVRDWLSDPQLKMASHTTKGVWIDLLAFMWEAPERGEITGTHEQIAKMVGAMNGDFEVFLSEAKDLSFCDISVTDHNKITVRNRRMWRDEKERKNNRLRQQRFRDKQKNNEEITPPSSSSTSSSNKNICPQSEIVTLFNEIFPNSPKPRSWDGDRAQNLRARWNEDEKRQNLDWWERFFNWIKKSPFLMGEIEPRQGFKRFTLKLDWLVKKSNFLKVLEGDYHRN